MDEARVDRIYRDRGLTFAQARDRLAGRSRRFGHLRLAAFLLAALPFLWPNSAGEPDLPVRIGLGALFATAFVVLVVLQNRVDRHREWYEALHRLTEEGRARLRRDWAALPDRGRREPDPEHPYTQDLDIFGVGSLRDLLGPVATASGQATLSEWLRRAAGPEAIRERQAAVAELAPMRDFRDELAALGRTTAAGTLHDPNRFLTWAEGPGWLEQRGWLYVLAWILPTAFAFLAILHLAGVLSYHGWLVVVVINLTLTFTVGREIHRIFDRAIVGESSFQAHAELLRRVTETTFEAPRLQRLQSEIGTGGIPAHEQMARLHRLGRHADLRLSMFWLPIQLICLWDVHVLARLEGWQQRAGRRARTWLNVLGEVEALAALATLRHDHPGWAVPELREGEAPMIEAFDLGHPLLAEATRVTNDVEVGPPGTFLFITGSNMSGKSTLLRAIGTNVVLAQAGAPVCARSMSLSPVRLHTSMRVHDSLQQGLSHYMAELERLKTLVDRASGAGRRGERSFLYLLDDILQGTNTAERRIAAREILRHLVEEGAIGAVTSHDLALVEVPDLRAATRPVHFRETIRDTEAGPEIHFDYRLRPGVASSSNALKLLELVGLGPAEAGDDAVGQASERDRSS